MICFLGHVSPVTVELCHRHKRWGPGPQKVGPRRGKAKRVTRKSVQWPIGNPPLSEKACSNANVAGCPGLENAFLYILGQKLR